MGSLTDAVITKFNITSNYYEWRDFMEHRENWFQESETYKAMNRLMELKQTWKE